MHHLFGIIEKIKICAGFQKKVDFVILDNVNTQYTIPLVEGDEYFIIDVRNEICVFLSFSIQYYFISHFLKSKSVRLAYICSILDVLQPRIVITTVDNSVHFYHIARYYSKCRFLAIQNGSRQHLSNLQSISSIRKSTLSIVSKENDQDIFIPEFACFGQHEINLYHGKQVGKFIPIGSLADSYYRASKFYQRNRPKIYDICVVSSGTMTSWDTESADGSGPLASYAIRYGKENNKLVCIAGKRHANSLLRKKEIEWYRKYIADDAENIQPVKKNEFSTYQLIDSSEVSVSFMSTALLEGFCRNNKVLFCNYTGDNLWDFPVEGLWTLTDKSYQKFSERMDELLSISRNEFNKLSKDAKMYVMNYDESAPPIEFLTKYIRD